MSEALFGFLGVLVGSFIPLLKELIVEKRMRTERAKYLAVRIICILDEYIDKCIEVIHDDGSYMGQASERDESGNDIYTPVVKLPAAPTFPDDVDWKSIDGALMYRILSLPNTVRGADNFIQWAGSELAFPPYYEEAFEARQKGYAMLGLEAIDVTDVLRTVYKLPKKPLPTLNDEWNPKHILTEKLRKFEEQ